MAENPLLPHEQLRALYALMTRVQTSLDTGPRSVRGLEAILSAAVLQLETGDVFCGQSAAKLKTMFSTHSEAAALCDSALRDSTLPDLVSLIAFGFQAVKRKSAAVCLTATTTSVNWADIFLQAQHARLPVVFLIAETGTPAKRCTPLPWSTLVKHAKAAYIPTISVDGADAVALYRVVQESLHRARLGDGPTVAWCALPANGPRRKKAAAVTALEHYLAVRGLHKSTRRRSALGA